MEKMELEELNEDLHKKYTLSENHIGIRNVNQRLHLLLGDEVEVRLSNNENAGMKVTFILPLLLV